MHADDLVLISSSVNMLQKMINICYAEANYLDLRFNVLKSTVFYVDKHFNGNNCAKLYISDCQIDFDGQSKYLGARLVGEKILKLCKNEQKQFLSL